MESLREYGKALSVTVEMVGKRLLQHQLHRLQIRCRQPVLVRHHPTTPSLRAEHQQTKHPWRSPSRTASAAKFESGDTRRFATNHAIVCHPRTPSNRVKVASSPHMCAIQGAPRSYTQENKSRRKLSGLPRADNHPRPHCSPQLDHRAKPTLQRMKEHR